MKKIIFIILFCIAPLVLYASPFLVCDPQSGVESYRFTGDTFFNTITAQADGSLRYDLAGIPMGEHQINVSACNMWGCSTATFFEFSARIPNVPSQLRLVP